uniref:Uncharacterized protein n=1 Tax=Chromera velia CCMP2878 TaxID=1169474 RepID=A0A0G4HY05_9ALVE|eukprot:Cvel_9391.t1-p1 / transcript=Cvel_9391.t1 / gene=Cvel_9391 / organism=Chromera_velia_CCMP2878 / gene_product=hypothetical protein / transcript_product=hypothetical protein / location=Cvel_scaffold539:64724-69940(+) / protein_length=390 / sequence_SO=supercontig / SO=protein_coding / is_pseudo=false
MLLEHAITGKRDEWESSGALYKGTAEGGFGLPPSFPIDYALVIFVHTLDDPAVCLSVNKVMYSPERSAGPGGISPELRACLNYIQFLDTALEALPSHYHYRGEVRRGVPWVFPSVDHHDPVGHFTRNSLIQWYEFKSTTKEAHVMMEEAFCGPRPGPRTVFVIQASQAYDIEKFSLFQEEACEFEVLFRPLSTFWVTSAQQFITDPKETVFLLKSGFPDVVNLVQVDAQRAASPSVSSSSSSSSPSMVQPDEVERAATKRQREEAEDSTDDIEETRENAHRKKDRRLLRSTKIESPSFKWNVELSEGFGGHQPVETTSDAFVVVACLSIPSASRAQAQLRVKRTLSSRLPLKQIQAVSSLAYHRRTGLDDVRPPPVPGRTAPPLGGSGSP